MRLASRPATIRSGELEGRGISAGLKCLAVLGVALSRNDHATRDDPFRSNQGRTIGRGLRECSCSDAPSGTTGSLKCVTLSEPDRRNDRLEFASAASCDSTVNAVAGRSSRTDLAPGARARGQRRHPRHPVLGVKVILVGREDVIRRELDTHDSYDRSLIQTSTPASRSPWRTAPPRRCAPRRTAPFASPPGWFATESPTALSPPATPARSWPPPRWCRASSPASTGPALASVFPTLKGTPAVMVDVGANVDCDAEDAGAVRRHGRDLLARDLPHANPRVGLLSIGEEEHKGNDLTRAATPLLKDRRI